MTPTIHSEIAEDHRIVMAARTSLVINRFANQSDLAEVGASVSLMRAHIEELESSPALDRRRSVSFDLLGVFGTGED